MKLNFTKMHGLGNDFMVIDAIKQPVDIQQLNIKTLGDRHLGVGFDQLLLLAPSQKANAYCYIYNTDGSESEQCGNGLRCVARYLHENKLVNSNSFTIETNAGLFPVTIQDYDHICVSLGIPQIREHLIDVHIASQTLPITILDTGNPHAIVRVTKLDEVPIEQWGNEIAALSYFPNSANVGFMQIINRQHARLRTLERGVGETNACGSNACAAAVAGINNNWLDPQVKIEFKLGNLTIEWAGKDKPIQMTGPAVSVYTGIIS